MSCVKLLICFCVTGVLLTLLGVSSMNRAREQHMRSSSAEQVKTDPMIIIGPILLSIGFFIGTIGGMFYGKYYRRFQNSRNDHTHAYGNQGLHIDDLHGESYKRTVTPNLTPDTSGVFTVEESVRSNV